MENDVQPDKLIDDTRPSSNDSMRLAMATQLLDTMHGQIRVADEKIRGLFGATALLAAALAFNTQQPFSQGLSGGWSLSTIAEFVCGACCSSLLRAQLPLRCSRSCRVFVDIAPTVRFFSLVTLPIRLMTPSSTNFGRSLNRMLCSRS
jgi:hypothetical protein